MSTATNDLVLRCQWESYMEIPATGAQTSPTLALIGEGFTTFPESKNPKEYTRKYVNYKTEKTDVIGYAPSIAYSCDVITNEPVVEQIVEITDNEYLGTDTHRDIVSVNLWEEVTVGQSTQYKAFKRTYAIIPDGKGDGTDALIYTGTMKAVSDVIFGTFDKSTKTFTAASTGGNAGGNAGGGENEENA